MVLMIILLFQYLPCQFGRISQNFKNEKQLCKHSKNMKSLLEIAAFVVMRLLRTLYIGY